MTTENGGDEWGNRISLLVANGCYAKILIERDKDSDDDDDNTSGDDAGDDASSNASSLGRVPLACRHYKGACTRRGQLHRHDRFSSEGEVGHRDDQAARHR